jgi:YHS domain-containing protein
VIRVILIAALILVIAQAFWRLVDGIMEGAGARRRRHPAQRPVTWTRDPVCGRYVPVGGSVALRVGGTTHYFCSTACRDQYHRAS